ncbi:hypothetical protein, partial [Staphylococcus aureus]
VSGQCQRSIRAGLDLERSLSYGDMDYMVEQNWDENENMSRLARGGDIPIGRIKHFISRYDGE